MSFQSFSRLFHHLIVCTTLLGLPAAAALSALRAARVISPALSKRLDCETVGDGDLYGLGVRLGFYLQWASGFILRNLGSWETVSRVRTSNNALCSALALAAAINLSAGSALTLDYLLSFHLTVVLFYSESYNLLARGKPSFVNSHVPKPSTEERIGGKKKILKGLKSDHTLKKGK